MDFTTAVTGRIIQGLGMPMLFVTASYLTMAYVSIDQMNNATAIFIIYQGVRRQAAAMAFSDTFFIQAFIFIGLIGLLFFVRKPPIGKAAAPPGH